jgi:hypothetical protein
LLLSHSEATRPYRRFGVGVLLAAAVLVPISMWSAGGLTEGARVYRAFLDNSVKHVQTPLVNYMGLRTVLAYRPSEVARHLRDNRFFAPWKRWSESRREAFRQALPAYVAVALRYVILLAGGAARRARDEPRAWRTRSPSAEPPPAVSFISRWRSTRGAMRWPFAAGVTALSQAMALLDPGVADLADELHVLSAGPRRSFRSCGGSRAARTPRRPCRRLARCRPPGGATARPPGAEWDANIRSPGPPAAAVTARINSRRPGGLRGDRRLVGGLSTAPCARAMRSTRSPARD